MCTLPLIQIWAMPSQPLLPYDAEHTSMRPLVGRQFFARVPPASASRSNTSEALQSEIATARYGFQTADTLSPTFNLNGFSVRAQ
jgi:hypothetical protein